MKIEWSREVRIRERSKRWWKRQWKEQRKAARKCKKARKEWHKGIKKAKSNMWKQWVEEGKNVWAWSSKKPVWDERKRGKYQERT